MAENQQYGQYGRPQAGQGSANPQEDALRNLAQAASAARPPIQSRQVPGGYHPCPNCHGINVRKVGFTWWGGVLGPSLFCHCKCHSCGATFNGKTGQSNTGAITVYVAVTTGIAILLLIAMAIGGAH